MLSKIRIAVVDPQPLFREGIAYCLAPEQGLHIVGQGSTADDALCVAQRLRPDVLAKGDTVAPEEIVGHESVERHGGKVEVIPLLEGSTTVSEILARAIRERKGGGRGGGGRRS